MRPNLLPRCPGRGRDYVAGLATGSVPCRGCQLSQDLGSRFDPWVPQLEQCRAQGSPELGWQGEGSQPVFQRLDPAAMSPLGDGRNGEEVLGDPDREPESIDPLPPGAPRGARQQANQLCRVFEGDFTVLGPAQGRGAMREGPALPVRHRRPAANAHDRGIAGRAVCLFSCLDRRHDDF